MMALVAGLAAMLGFGAFHPAGAADKVRVGTPEGSSFVFALLDAGVGAGIFAAHDLDIEKINFAGAGKLDQGMTSGAIDVSLAGNAELAYVAKGVPQIGVAAMAGAPVDMSIIVRMDHDITKPADLKGRTIGVTSETSLTSYLVLAFSEQQGWGNDGMKRAYLGSMSSSVPALLVKNVDAIVGPVEAGLVLESQGKARALVTFGDMKMFITHVICAGDMFAKDHPDVLKRFLAAWFETVGWANAHKQDTVRLVLPVTGLTPDIASKIYDNDMPAMSLTGRFDPTAVATTMKSFTTLGLLTTVPHDKELYTEKYLP
jgi:ABC-type nitrate/sulfonate/bicarbonate transport system substrate-binding protein